MTTWNDTTTISIAWGGDDTTTQGRFTFNEIGIKFNEPGLSFNGIVDYDHRELLYTTVAKPTTAWATT